MKYFTFEELTRSAVAELKNIDNTPTNEIKYRMRLLVEKLLDPMRSDWENYCYVAHLGSPGIRITSGYRCPELNAAVGGVKTSAHQYGWAADVQPVNGEMEEFKRFVSEWFQDKVFDQVIIEKAGNGVEWIHIALKNSTGKQRKQIFSMDAE